MVLACFTQKGRTAMIQASEEGHADCVHLLVDCGADKDAKDDVHVAIICSFSVMTACVRLFAC